MHYLIIIVIIALILYLQIKFFLSTNTLLEKFENVFGEDKNLYQLSSKAIDEKIQNAKDDELKNMLRVAGFDLGEFESTEEIFTGEYISTFYNLKAKRSLKDKYQNISGIFTKHDNDLLKIIFEAINGYLSKNKGKDFHLLKDIVDRNCDAAEEEIQTQIPVPLYLGLVGTMAGILVGVSFLVFTGGLKDLLSSTSSTQNGAEGVEALMGGVAIAMIASIVGIVLTTLGANNAKTIKTKVEEKKNIFFSWIQAELLPTMSDSITDTLEKLTHNLKDFNDTFSANTKNFGKELSKIDEIYNNQIKLIDTINKFEDKNVASNNIKLLSKLIECSGQIGTLGTYLEDVNGYLTNVRALNSKLDDYENRTQVIEAAGKFYSKNEKWLSDNFDSANLEVKGSLDRFHDTIEKNFEKHKESISSHLIEIDDFMSTQNSSIEVAFNDQEQILKGKFQETSKLLTELQNLSAVKSSMEKIEKATTDQNKKLDKLADAINKLAEIKVGERPQTKTPIWLIASSIGAFFVVIVPLATTVAYLMYKFLIS